VYAHPLPAGVHSLLIIRVIEEPPDAVADRPALGCGLHGRPRDLVRCGNGSMPLLHASSLIAARCMLRCSVEI
jgi:hypothetical protein